MKDYDVIIIGAGVSGCAIARELAKGKLRIAVLEAKSDVCEGTSKANSGIVHAGYDAVPGTLKAQLNVRGNEMMEELSKKLDFPFRRNGSLVLCFEEDAMSGLEELYQRGMENGVKELKLLSPEEVWAMEPAVSRDIVGALYAPTGGIVCPFGLNIALAENAAENGVEFYRDHKVTAIVEQRPVWTENPPAKEGRMYQVQVDGEIFVAPIVINAAGVYADEIHNMICEEKIRIVPRRGEYRLMDKNCGDLVNSTIFQQPSKMGKGILVTPTVHGNLLVGPTAEDIPDKQDVDTTAEGLTKVLNLGSNSVDALDGRQTITSFAGLELIWYMKNLRKNRIFSLARQKDILALLMWQVLNLRDSPVHRLLASMWHGLLKIFIPQNVRRILLTAEKESPAWHLPRKRREKH